MSGSKDSTGGKVRSNRTATRWKLPKPGKCRCPTHKLEKKTITRAGVVIRAVECMVCGRIQSASQYLKARPHLQNERQK